jgi:hypothetical protein
VPLLRLVERCLLKLFDGHRGELSRLGWARVLDEEVR